MTTNDLSQAEFTTVRPRRWAPWILVPAILGGLVGVALATSVTPIYKAEALVGVAPQRTAGSQVPTTSSEIAQVAQRMWQSIVSRTRLERLIDEFDLYKEQRVQGADRQEIIETMRTHVELRVAASERGDAAAFRIAFTGPDPGTVMRVTERLTELLIRAHLGDRRIVAEGTHTFLSGRLEATRARLDEKSAQLRAATAQRQPEAEPLAIELEVLQATFSDLSLKTEEARLATEPDAGGQLVILEPARLPERPIAPDWRAYVGSGAAAGLAVGLLLLVASSDRHRRESDPPP
jgi:uncharacterized protein involved in exopolysaccharide biosynthesis